MLHQIPLQELPADFQPPEDLKERFWYDADGKQLCFEGFMSKATYDRLERLSGETTYQRALDDLFRVSVPDELAAAASSKSGLLITGALTALGIGALAAWGLLF